MPFVWDLTHNIHFSQWKEESYEDYLPCLVRGHRYYHCGRKRHSVVGWELRGFGWGLGTVALNVSYMFGRSPP